MSTSGDYERGLREGISEAIQIATEQAAMMADLAIKGMPENARNREAMEAALTRFSTDLRVTLEGLSIPSRVKMAGISADLISVLQDCEDYFDNRADADCDQDGFIPNEEMKLLSEVREALRKAGAA